MPRFPEIFLPPYRFRGNISENVWQFFNHPVVRQLYICTMYNIASLKLWLTPYFQFEGDIASQHNYTLLISNDKWAERQHIASHIVRKIIL